MTDLFGHDLDDEVAVSRWAFALPPDERDRLLLATASVLAAEDLRARPRATQLLDALLPALAKDADAHTRRELAQRLSAAPWAPEALLLDLAFDPELDVQPAVARAPGLSESALVRLAARGGPETLAVLARRPSLPPPVLDALVEAATALPALRDPLARRADLTPEAARRLHGVAGPDLAPALAARFDLPPVPAATPVAESDVRLVDKLHAAGQLTPDYALNALRRGRPGVFGQAVARLTDLAPTTVAEALQDEAPDSLALLCAAVPLDRAVYPAVLSGARAARGLPPGASASLSPEARAAFDHTPGDAARLLRTAAGRRAARWTPPEPVA